MFRQSHRKSQRKIDYPETGISTETSRKASPIWKRNRNEDHKDSWRRMFLPTRDWQRRLIWNWRTTFKWEGERKRIEIKNWIESKIKIKTRIWQQTSRKFKSELEKKAEFEAI